MSYAPFGLAEARISCWTAGGQEVFLGCEAHDVQLEGQFTEVLSATSGQATRTTHIVDEEHTIQMRRTWVIRANDAVAPVFDRAGTYTLAIVWTIPGPGGRHWRLTRTYTGVTWQGGSWTSVGGHAFGQNQRFRARQFTEAAVAV